MKWPLFQSMMSVLPRHPHSTRFMRVFLRNLPEVEKGGTSRAVPGPPRRRRRLLGAKFGRARPAQDGLDARRSRSAPSDLGALLTDWPRIGCVPAGGGQNPATTAGGIDARDPDPTEGQRLLLRRVS